MVRELGHPFNPLNPLPNLQPPFRLGATSYILPDDLVLNARYLAGLGGIRDMQLILFDLDDGPSNLPSPTAVAELASIGQAHDLTFTVHLPLDLRLGPGGEEDHESMVKARKIIECARGLDPRAYVAHLDGREVRTHLDTPELARWQSHIERALGLVSEWAGGPERVAVENLETYPLDFLMPVLDRVPVNRCVDIGHLWLDGHDPLPYLRSALPRLRVVHLHGINGRDHQSLAHAPHEKLRPVVELLLNEGYREVLTLEVFGEEDFHSSLNALRDCLAEITNGDR